VRRIACLTAAAIACCLSVAPFAEAQGRRVRGGAVEVQTAPALPNVRLSLDGVRYRTDRQGRALVRGASSTAELEQRLRVDTSRVARDVRARFSGWYRGRITLAVDYFVRPRFIDAAGDPIDPARIDSITLRNSHGLPEQFDSGRLGWLQGRGVRPAGVTPAGVFKLARRPVFHSFQRVVVDGSNVINRGQQRFWPVRDRRPQIQLLFFSARFRARDALFGFPVGSGITLEFPNGRRERFEFESDADLTLPSLPRGSYDVDVEGGGVSFSRPLSLSRNQDLELQVITWLDFAAALMLLLTIVVGLLLIGRPRLARRVPLIGPRLSRRARVGSRS
jgi:hypothetical protein